MNGNLQFFTSRIQNADKVRPVAEEKRGIPFEFHIIE